MTTVAVDFRPLTTHTGAEVTGCDLGKLAENATKELLRRMLAERGVLVFRDQKLTPPEFIQAGRTFGELMPQQVSRFTLKGYPLVGFVSSEDTDRPGGQRIIRGEQYHTDHSFAPAPPMATMLHAIDIPSVGGDTQFVNVLAAYDDLPDETKREIDPLRVLHTYHASRSPRKKAELSEEERRSLPESMQPLVLLHPYNNRRALYLNTAHMERISGMDDDRAFKLIESLMQHATQSKYEYRHKWQCGDVVIWDNRSVMHQANGDYPLHERRYLLRLLVKGEKLRPAV